MQPMQMLRIGQAAFFEAGIEVAFYGDAPAGQNGRFFAYVDAVPRAVGVVDGAGLGLSKSPARLSQYRDLFLETGHELLSLSPSADRVTAAARRAGVAAGAIFHDLDSKNQNAGVMRRFMSHGVSKSKQLGTVVMVLRLHQASIDALEGWAACSKV